MLVHLLPGTGSSYCLNHVAFCPGVIQRFISRLAFVASSLIIVPAVPFMKCCPVAVDWWARSLLNAATIDEEAVGSNYCQGGHSNSDIVDHFGVLFFHFAARIAARYFLAPFVSLPAIPSTEYTIGVKSIGELSGVVTNSCVP